MLHIENLTVHMNSGPSALSRAFIAALFQTPEAGEESAPTAPSPAAVQSETNPPRIGEYWTGMGGIYAGIARGRDGDADYHLILSNEAPSKEFAWQAALDHAKTVEVDGHKDFTVPTRFESALLYANLQDKFDTNYWYWTSTEYSENLAYVQLFDDGSQGNNYKDNERRCRFVRKLVI